MLATRCDARGWRAIDARHPDRRSMSVNAALSHVRSSRRRTRTVNCAHRRRPDRNRCPRPRRIRVRRFPFYVVYRDLADEIELVALAPMKRKPGYWRWRTS
jgi:hypothetical protein